MSSPTLRLIAIVLAFVATILAAAATGTLYWVSMEGTYQGLEVKQQMGLFKTCADSPVTSECFSNTYSSDDEDDVICGDHTGSQANAFVKGLQALSILSACFGGLAVAAAVVRTMFGGHSLISRPSFGLWEAVLAYLGALCAFVTWTVFTYFVLSWLYCGKSVCSIIEGGYPWSTFQCGFHFSYAMSVAASVLLTASGTCFIVGHSRAKVSITNGMYQDTDLIR
jgi:hypothetical protein